VIRLEKKKKPNLKKFFDIIEFDWEGGLEELNFFGDKIGKEEET